MSSSLAFIGHFITWCHIPRLQQVGLINTKLLISSVYMKQWSCNREELPLNDGLLSDFNSDVSYGNVVDLLDEQNMTHQTK